ncbi:histone deacetylase family protein [Blastochloris viridis]|uniref:Acetylspermidine deacetylase n=1 Tax=Blastochloris viridis TaxID=1079 RepID=A0A0H5BH34_BLAVI|nr:histone deacetylase family protein [Blastochloris viridis]ALK09681.1 Histone deacetylase-like amidohydrolase [Blastochloris viridis]BAS00430.1 acetylspermidine deacetylase [Blastochloris viridis]CUU42344.1 Histone deacetylase-like amidohydrolase [Blastochloris viridis]
MSTLLVSNPLCLNHMTPLGHPERPDRLRVVERILEHERFQVLAREAAQPVEIDVAARVHPMHYLEMLHDSSPLEGMVQIDNDTSLSPGTWHAARLSAGGSVMAVDEVMTGKVTNAFVAIRPPGHHAESATPMGFCYLNNAAVAARHAQAAYGAGRVAIVDFDVHHGNGTQQIFWSDPSVMYCSTHEMPLYPGTGAPSETGVGNIVNVPLAAGDGGPEFKAAYDGIIFPRLKLFKPDLIIISAGFDAHVRDPLANINLIEADFAWVTKRLMEIADESCGNRVVSILEGGYDLEGLARSTAAHVMTLMGA